MLKNINFKYKDIIFNGDTIGGSISKGIVVEHGIIKIGTFYKDELHGPNCTYHDPVKGIKKTGNFSNGKLTNGVLEINQATYKGVFNDNDKFEGSMISGDIQRYGKFEHLQLKNGITVTNDAVYTGDYIYGRFVKGTVAYNNIDFTAKLEIHPYKLYSCEVTYDGYIEDLNPDQLVMWCCQGENSIIAYEAFMEYLKDFTPGMIRDTMIEYDDIRLTAGLLQIKKNINKAKFSGKECSYKQGNGYVMFGYSRYNSHD